MKENITTRRSCDQSLIKTDSSYLQWIAEIKQRFLSCQAKAMVKVNTELLSFYWSIGRDLNSMNICTRWGEGIVREFAIDMRKAFPDEKGFSDTNIKYMKRWYLFYSKDFKKSHQVGDQIEMPTQFGKIPWRHHIQIFTKSKSVEEALYYINKTIEGNWSRSILESQMRSNLYYRQGAAITNFDTTVPDSQSGLIKDLLKDPYNFDFLKLGKDYNEKDLENALMENVTKFLLELGKGFALVGRQMELRMPDGESFFPDLIFYHIPQKRYILVELKTTKFVPEFVGKLNFYVTAIDRLLKSKDDNPSIGMLICKSTDKTVVEWSLQDICKPLGIATYQLQEVVDRTISELDQRRPLPSLR